MKKAYLFWLAEYAAGIVAALVLGLVVLLIVAWGNVFRPHIILGLASTALGVVISLLLLRAVPNIRRRADERRIEEPDESLSGLLRDLKEARTKREEREQRERLRRRGR